MKEVSDSLYKMDFEVFFVTRHIVEFFSMTFSMRRSMSFLKPHDWGTCSEGEGALVPLKRLKFLLTTDKSIIIIKYIMKGNIIWD